MPQSGGSETATDLREQAARLWNFMKGLTRQADRDRLRAVAEELEARAAKLDKDEPNQTGRRLSLTELSVAQLRAKAKNYRQMATTATTATISAALQRLARRLDALADERGE